MFSPKKKKPEPSSAPAPDELRKQYRKRSSRTQRLEATLSVPGWPPQTVELIDLTMRGAGVRVPFANDRNLKLDDVVELAIGAMMRDEITTPARVVNAEPEGDSHVRYGFEFININKLYSQLDAFYARHFNRRRHTRVLPSLDRKLHANITWESGLLRVQVSDVSESGIGLVLSRDSAALVLDVKSFKVRFTLPGHEEELSGAAVVKHRTLIHQHVLVGLAFDLETPDGFIRHAPALHAFVEQRAAEIAMWDPKK